MPARKTKQDKESVEQSLNFQHMSKQLERIEGHIDNQGKLTNSLITRLALTEERIAKALESISTILNEISQFQNKLHNTEKGMLKLEASKADKEQIKRVYDVMSRRDYKLIAIGVALVLIGMGMGVLGKESFIMGIIG
jgi:chromosome segregation ATPase